MIASAIVTPTSAKAPSYAAVLAATAAANVPTLALMFALAAALAWRRPAHGAATLAALMLYSYWVHRMAHTPPMADLPFVRLHHALHHGGHDRPGAPLRVEALTHELLCNFFFVGGAAALFVPGVAGRALHPAVTLFYSCVYAAGHLLDFHRPAARGGFHSAHHRDAHANLSPSLLDAAFGTAAPCNNGARHEALRPVTLVACAAGAWALAGALGW